MRVRYGKPIKVRSILGKCDVSFTYTSSNTTQAWFIRNNQVRDNVGGTEFTFNQEQTHKYFVAIKTSVSNITDINCGATGASSDSYFSDTVNQIYSCVVYWSDSASDRVLRGYFYNNDTKITPISGTNYYGILIDLTAIGLDNLTAEQFYNKYNKYFHLIATGEEITIDDKVGQVSLGTRLPLEYQQVEYIESDGYQYIDSEILSSTKVRTVFDFEDVSLNSNYNRIFGTTGSSGSQYGCRGSSSSNGYLYFEIPSGLSYTSTISLVTNERYLINFNDNNDTYINNIKIYEHTGIISDITGSQNIWLFAHNNSSKSSIKLYSCKIYNNNTLVRDFIPCYRKSDNEIGLYDLVGKQFYTNQGTGTFLKGNNVNNTISCKVAGGSSDIYYGYNSIFDFSASAWTNDNADTFTMTKTTDKLSFECHTAGSRNNKGITTNILVVAGHKYLLSYDILSTVPYNLDASRNTVSPSTVINMYPTSVVANELTNVQMIVQAENNLTWRMGRGSTTIAVGDTIEFSNIYIIDLTEWFEAGKEPTTVQEFKEKFTKEYYGYCPTTIKLTRYQIEALPTYGYNQGFKHLASNVEFRVPSNILPNMTITRDDANNMLTCNFLNSTGVSQAFYGFCPMFNAGDRCLLTFEAYSTKVTVDGISLYSGITHTDETYEKYTSEDLGTWKRVGQFATYTSSWTTTNYAYYRFINCGSHVAGDTLIIKNIEFFNLTDWYGAGNEPTTMEEFKATFPNKYYLYSKKRLLNKYMINKLIN